MQRINVVSEKSECFHIFDLKRSFHSVVQGLVPEREAFVSFTLLQVIF
jgi:hypothetical protein